MGSVKVDIHKHEKSLDQMYELTTGNGVTKLLENLTSLRGARERGDLDASSLLMDFFRAYREAGLSIRENQVLVLRYEQELTLNQVARQLDISRRSVQDYANRAVEKIAEAVSRQNGGQ